MVDKINIALVINLSVKCKNDEIFSSTQRSIKNYGFLYFGKNMDKNIGKNISKKGSGKYGQKRLDHAKQIATDAIKTS